MDYRIPQETWGREGDGDEARERERVKSDAWEHRPEPHRTYLMALPGTAYSQPTPVAGPFGPEAHFQGTVFAFDFIGGRTS